MKLIKNSFTIIIFISILPLFSYSIPLELNIGGGYESWQKNSSYYEENSFLTSISIKLPIRLGRLLFAPIVCYRYSNNIKYSAFGIEFNYLIHPDYMPFIGLKGELRNYNLNIEDLTLTKTYTLSFVGGSKILKGRNFDLWLKIELLLINSQYKNIAGNGFYLELGYSFDLSS